MKKLQWAQKCSRYIQMAKQMARVWAADRERTGMGPALPREQSRRGMAAAPGKAVRPDAGLSRPELCLLAGLCLAVLYAGWLAPFARTAAEVRADTLRLHVRAASDSREDQRLKLLVRDAVLQEAGTLFAPAASAGEAAALARAALPRLEEAARQALAKAGAEGDVTVRLTRQYFPTTRYEGFTLPAGAYRAVRVDLGEARGRNWWCVLYPGLCLGASGVAGTYGDAGQRQLIAGGYELRFALVELWEGLRCRDIPAAGGIG